MTTNTTYQEEKAAVWKMVERHTGVLEIPGRSKDWRVTKDKDLSIFVTYSKIHPRYQAYWYDVSRKDISMWLDYNEPFVILVAGSRNNTFVIPVDKLFQSILAANISGSPGIAV